MFLSVEAKKLLDEGKHEELAALPLSRLLDAYSLEKVTDDRFDSQPVSSTAFASCPNVATDPIMFCTPVDPVVISSGHIFSKATIDTILANEAKIPRCPNTNQEITCVVRLPNITYALAQWKLVQEVKRAQSLPRVSALEKDFSVEFCIKVSGNKIRLEFDGPHSPLKAFLGYLFFEKENDTGVGRFSSYGATDWSFAWQSQSEYTRMEWWFPLNGLLNDDINLLLERILAPLNMLAAENVECPKVSISKLQGRQYVTAVPNMSLTHLKASECCLAFFIAAKDFREKRAVPGTIFKDEIVTFDAALPAPRQELGLRQFSAIGSSARFSFASPASSASAAASQPNPASSSAGQKRGM